MVEGDRGDTDRQKKREGPPHRLGAGRLPSGGGTDAADRRAGPMTAGQSPRGGNLRRLLDEFKRLLNISPSAFCVCVCFVSFLCRSAIPAGAAWPMMTGCPRPGCAAAAPGPGCGRQAGRYYGRGSGKSGGLFWNGGRVFPHIPSTPPWVSENCLGGSPESWLEIIWEQFRTSERRRFFPVLLFDLYRVTVTMGRLYADAEMTG